MAKKVEIKKTVFNRKEFNGVIDSKFRFFKEPEPVTDPDTVQELFRLYDKLYALIPIEGEIQTHQYLVERSSELYKIDVQLESIQPLLDEIASLRTQNLEGNRRILELEMQLANGGEINFSDGEQMALLRTQLDTANQAIASLETANTLANQATTQAQAAATAAATAAAAAAQAASEQAASSAAEASTQQDSTSKYTKEIVDLFNKKNTEYYHAKRFLSEKKYYTQHFQRRNNGWNYGHFLFVRGVQDYSWLVEDTGDRSYNGKYRFKLLFENIDDARRLTMAYVVKNLETAGYTANEIVAAVESLGNFRGNVRMRLIEYRDSDKDPKAGYNIVT
jgi:chemotaxis protein histidine kinase CheA